MYSNMKYYKNICNCLRVIQQDINRKLKSANCWQRTSLNDKDDALKFHAALNKNKIGLNDKRKGLPTLFKTLSVKTNNFASPPGEQLDNNECMPYMTDGSSSAEIDLFPLCGSNFQVYICCINVRIN